MIARESGLGPRRFLCRAVVHELSLLSQPSLLLLVSPEQSSLESLLSQPSVLLLELLVSPEHASLDESLLSQPSLVVSSSPALVVVPPLQPSLGT
jgi:hypothetical protein